MKTTLGNDEVGIAIDTRPRRHIFAKEAVMLDAHNDTLGLSGLMGLPTMNRPTTQYMNIFVNQRPVKDKQLVGAIRAAYADTLPRGRYPFLALFITVAHEDVDVNVHPAKSEVRFSDPSAIRSLIVGSIQSALRNEGIQATAELSQNVFNRLSVGKHRGKSEKPNLASFESIDVSFDVSIYRCRW